MIPHSHITWGMNSGRSSETFSHPTEVNQPISQHLNVLCVFHSSLCRRRCKTIILSLSIPVNRLCIRWLILIAWSMDSSIYTKPGRRLGSAHRLHEMSAWRPRALCQQCPILSRLQGGKHAGSVAISVRRKYKIRSWLWCSLRRHCYASTVILICWIRVPWHTHAVGFLVYFSVS
jgi:hypothetical protein